MTQNTSKHLSLHMALVGQEFRNGLTEHFRLRVSCEGTVKRSQHLQSFRWYHEASMKLHEAGVSTLEMARSQGWQAHARYWQEASLHCHMDFFIGQFSVSSWHGSWHSSERVIQEAIMFFMTPNSESTLHHFCNSLLISQASPVRPGGELYINVNTYRWGLLGVTLEAGS